jgi:hypothetical protein
MATFGKNTTTGAGAVSAASGATFYMRIQMGAVSGTATSISWYTASTAGSNIKFALYADASTLPTTVLGSGTGSVSTTTGWNTINLSSSVAVTASTWYWIGVRAATATTNVYYATVAAANAGRSTTTYAAFPAASPTFNASYTTRDYAAYVTYTEDSGVFNEFYYRSLLTGGM